MNSTIALRGMISKFIEQNGFDRNPKELYDPLNYIISNGGKRLRPICLLLVNEMFGGAAKSVLPAAYAIELFHNFSLIHDDIMDEAPLRRGKVTVHEKWDVNTGILSGDAMLIYSYQFLTAACTSANSIDIHKKFSDTAIAVCEGQQMDVNFENLDLVSRNVYIDMIYKKTGALIEGAMSIGAILADASPADILLIEQFAKNIGISFQLQDDILDAYGNPEDFGKQVGGDIIQNKKTILQIIAMEKANQEDRKRLTDLFGITSDSIAKVRNVMQVFDRYDVKTDAEQLRDAFHQKAFEALDNISSAEHSKGQLTAFVDQLLERKL